MDEWDGDADLLIRPYLSGHLSIGDLFAPYNEHRIAITRLLVLSILRISGYWDVVQQMIVDAFLDSATVVAIAYALARPLRGALAVAATIASVVINAVPYGYDSVLLGFNTHFYLLIAFSFASLCLLVASPAGSARAAAGALAALAAFLCMASGAIALIAAVATLGLQAACGRRNGVREGAGMAALLALAVALLALVPHVDASDAIKARSFGLNSFPRSCNSRAGRLTPRSDWFFSCPLRRSSIVSSPIVPR